jgi:hypothetical protein
LVLAACGGETHSAADAPLDPCVARFDRGNALALAAIDPAVTDPSLSSCAPGICGQLSQASSKPSPSS